MSENETGMDCALKLLQAAQNAANSGNVVEMLDALSASHYLDGLTRRLKYKWKDSLPEFEIEDSIVQAVDAAWATGREGRTIRSIGAWLWKSADNISEKKRRTHYAGRVGFDHGSVSGVSDTDETEREREEREKLEDNRRMLGIRIARELLPKVGEGQVRDVMELLIDAVEDGLPDLPPSDIANALGIKKNAARALLSRGTKRLRRLAEERGVEIPTDLDETDTYHLE